VAKLNQIIAVANGVKGRTQKAITEVYHKLQKGALLEGISRKYRPKEDEGERLPPETKLVNLRVSDALRDVAVVMTELFDVVATQDYANRKASAGVVLADGKHLLLNVPVTHLLFLEKQLVDIHTLVEKLPTLDLAEQWIRSEEADCYATATHETVRTKKIPRNHIKYEATKEHPAQVEMFTEDVVVGYWETVKFSGAIPESVKKEMIARVEQLQDAVKAAREEANSMEIEQVKEGKEIFNFLFSSCCGKL
jgi:hypothetical protein